MAGAADLAVGRKRNGLLRTLLQWWFEWSREGRMVRERRTIVAMLRIHCSVNHKDLAKQSPDHSGRPLREGLCESCSALHDYALLRLDRCHFQELKPTCAKCPIHCYAPRPREEIRDMMRKVGPRMLLKHPWLAMQHALDTFRPIPEKRPPVALVVE